MGRATPVYKKSASRIAGKQRPLDEVRAELKADVQRTVGAFARRVSKQRGLPADQAKVRIK
jgi:ClpP class serine protease